MTFEQVITEDSEASKHLVPFDVFSPLFWPTKHRPFLKITACPSWILDKNKLHKKIPEIFIWKEQKLSEISIWIVDLMNYLFTWKKFFWWFQNHRGPVGSFFFGFFEIGCYPIYQADHPLFCLIMTHMVMNHSIGHYEVKIFHKKKLQWVDLLSAFWW